MTLPKVICLSVCDALTLESFIRFWWNVIDGSTTIDTFAGFWDDSDLREDFFRVKSAVHNKTTSNFRIKCRSGITWLHFLHTWRNSWDNNNENIHVYCSTKTTYLYYFSNLISEELKVFTLSLFLAGRFGSFEGIFNKNNKTKNAKNQFSRDIICAEFLTFIQAEQHLKTMNMLHCLQYGVSVS